MLVTLVAGLVALFVLALAASVVFLAMDEEPQVQNERALRARAFGAAAEPTALPLAEMRKAA